MKIKTNLLLIVVSITTSLVGFTQPTDVVYFKSGTALSDVSVLSIDGRDLKYRTKTGSLMTTDTKEMVLVFNGQGKYLLFSDKYRALEGFDDWFFAWDNSSVNSDIIVTVNDKSLPAFVSEVNDDFIVYNNPVTNELNAKIQIQDVAVAIYRDGSHQLFVDPALASEHLQDATKDIKRIRKEIYSDPGLDMPKQDPEIPSAPVSPDLPEETISNEEFSMEVDYELYKRKALQKTQKLGDYLAIISDKSQDNIKRDDAIDLSLRLFLSDKEKVYVSGRSGKSSFPVRLYLNRLKVLGYDRVEISWSDISYVSKFLLSPDGNYYGTISFQQRFKGFLEGELVYGDVTKKDITVVLKKYSKESGGKSEELWDVYLSEIGVKETNIIE